MGMVYLPPVEHRCDPPERRETRRGSIWRCDDCGRYLHFTYTDESWGPVWTPVRWWNFRERKAIKRVLGMAVDR